MTATTNGVIPPRMPVTLLGWKPILRNSLRGFCDVRIGTSLIVRDVAVHVSNGRPWASLPSKPIINNADGVVQRDSAGKIKYAPIMEWADKAARDRFSASVVEAVDREHPDTLA